MSMRFHFCIATAAGLLGALAADAAAQVAPTPRGLGMGGAYVATARGHETLFLNSANLGLPGTPYWSIAMPQLILGGGTVGPTVRDTWDILQSNKQFPARRAELLGLVPDEGMELDLAVRAPLVAIQAGHLVLGASYGAIVDHSISKDLVELFVEGFETGRTDYQVGNTTGSRATFFDFAAGYGRRVGPLSVGVTGHYILGRTLSRSKLFEARIDPSAESIEIEYREVLARGGKGYGIDVGAAFQPTPSLTLSAAIANVVARMRWNEALVTRAMEITQDDFGAPTQHWEQLLSDFTRAEQPVDPHAAPLSVYETTEGLYHEAYFPATLRTGAAYFVGASRTHLEVSYQKQLTAGRLGDAWKRNLAVGLQQKLPLTTVRLGAATNGASASLLSAGITLGAMELGVARLRDAAKSDATRNGWIGSFGLHIGTRSTMP
jgi:hypothetical protein